MNVDDISILKTELEQDLAGEIVNVKILQSGWAGEIIACALKSGKSYIVKTYRSDNNGAKSIQTEWDGLNFLYNANHPVPKPFHRRLHDPFPYIIMEEIKGLTFWDAYKNASKYQKEKLLGQFVRTLYDLHQLNIQIAPTSAGKDSTSSFVQHEIETIKNLLVENDVADFLNVVEWLEKGSANVVGHGLSILHRDYHPWNVIISEKGQIFMIDILWGIGDYRFDLAWTCTLLARSGFTDLSEAISHKYEKMKQHQYENKRYFEVLATQRWLTNVITSLKTGKNLNETRKEEFKDFVIPLIENGLKLIEQNTEIRLNDAVDNIRSIPPSRTITK